MVGRGYDDKPRVNNKKRSFTSSQEMLWMYLDCFQPELNLDWWNESTQ